MMWTDQYLDGGKIDGKLYAINIGANAHAVLYDPAIFEKAGVPSTYNQDIHGMTFK